LPPQNNGGGPITAYRIYRGATAASLGATPVAVVPATGNDIWTDHSAAVGTDYWYGVAAVNAAGASPQQPAGDATPFDTALVFSTIDPQNGQDALSTAEGPSGGTPIESVLDDGYDNIEPAVSPDGRSVAFSSNKSGSYQIWSMPLDGSAAPRRLSHDGLNDYYPSWSPDGKSIAYTESNNGIDDTEIITATGSGGKTVADSQATLRPSWTPSGREIVAGSLKSGFGAVLLAVDGSERRLVPGSQGGQDPQVSPDGRTIALVEVDSQQAESCMGSNYTFQRTHIVTVPFVGGAARTIIPVSSDQDDPTWWPDGSRISIDAVGLTGGTGADSGCPDGSGVDTYAAEGSAFLGDVSDGGLSAYPTIQPSAPVARPVSAPGVPSHTSWSLATNGVVLRWTKPADPHLWQVVVREGGPNQPAPSSPDQGKAISGTNVTATATGLAPGVTYRFSIFAIDNAGTAGSPAVVTVTVPQDDAWSGLAYSHGWKAVESPNAWHGTLHETSTPMSSVSATLVGYQVAIYGETCKTCGAVQIRLNGRLAATLHPRSRTTVDQQLLWQSPRAQSKKKLTVNVEYVGTRTQRFALDAIGTNG
jgi:Tol biopolymer transport system component